MRKVQSEFPKALTQTCLSYACMARNNLYNHFGFTPSQIALGQNPKLPSVEHKKLPVMEGYSVSRTVSENLKLLEATRRAFLETECLDRVKRALKHNVPGSGREVGQGEKCYYRRNEIWHGPAIVLGKYGAIVFVRHGGEVNRCH